MGGVVSPMDRPGSMGGDGDGLWPLNRLQLIHGQNSIHFWGNALPKAQLICKIESSRLGRKFDTNHAIGMDAVFRQMAFPPSHFISDI